jgi:hypothetical protein
MKSHLSIQDVQPWGVRLMLLIIIGLPPLTGWPFFDIAHSSIVTEYTSGAPGIGVILPWILYAVFIWLFIALFAGADVLLNFGSIAGILGLTLLFWKATLGRLPILAGDKNALDISIAAVLQLVQIFTIVPFVLFLVHSFSAAGVLLWLSRHAQGRSGVAVHVVLFMRVFQSVVEAFVRLLDAWREENPRVIFPRFPGKMDRSLLNRRQWFGWVARTAWAWCVASLVFGLEPIPSLVDETKKVRDTIRLNSLR